MAAREIATEIRAARERRRARADARHSADVRAGHRRGAADPRALLVWQPLARAVARLFPSECAALDAAAGGTFPFTPDQFRRRTRAGPPTGWRGSGARCRIQAEGGREQEVNASGGSPAARRRLDAVEREKLDLYQRRYQEYVQVAKALQALTN